MIRPDIDQFGFTIAVCQCDVCNAETAVKAQHNRHRGNVSKREVVESQVLIKLQTQGWTYIKKTLRCASCEEERKKSFTTQKVMETIMVEQTTTDLRQPTREQKRQIMSLLDEVYDVQNGYYTGSETDKTIADTLGTGILPGWVAAIREEFFGPDGGNDELLQLREELSALKKATEQVAKTCHDDIQKALAALRDYNKLREKVSEYDARVEKLKRAIGPKAERV